MRGSLINTWLQSGRSHSHGYFRCSLGYVRDTLGLDTVRMHPVILDSRFRQSFDRRVPSLLRAQVSLKEIALVPWYRLSATTIYLGAKQNSQTVLSPPLWTPAQLGRSVQPSMFIPRRETISSLSAVALTVLDPHCPHLERRSREDPTKAFSHL